MKQQLLKALCSTLAFLVLVSCQKDHNDDIKGSPGVNGVLAAAKKKPVASGPKLRTILLNGNRYETFTYDQSGRLAASTTGQFKTTYSYGQNKLTFRTVDTLTNTFVQEKTGKLNAKGSLAFLEGNVGQAGKDEMYVQQSFTYDGANQLTKINAKVTTLKDTVIAVMEFVWKDGNRVNTDFISNGFYNSRMAYTYDLSKKNSLKVQPLFQFERLDGFLGKPNTNLLQREKEYYNGYEFDHDYVYAWDTDAAGLVTSYNMASVKTGALVGTFIFQYE